MAIIDFYEKPGCVGNAKQKALLQAAGHQSRVHNLLTATWSGETLRPFFGEAPVTEWFNPTAPPITAGEINPAAMDKKQALALMVACPILIRRPLLQVGTRRTFGFDLQAIDAWIGLAPSSDLTQDLQTCPRQA
ncbi:MAG: ArsC/Spx/MgsR family protein [Cyanobacteria bacterium P01_D01_bin.14]